MDDIKLFGKKMYSLIQAGRIYSQDIGIEFKCAMFIIRSGKRHITERIDLLNQEKIRMFGEKEN